MQVFFSHSSRDKPLLRDLRGYFPAWLSSWIDEDRLLFGSDLELSLRRAIDKEVDFVVLFVGREAFESNWVRREIKWSLEREEELGRTFLLPVLVDNVRDRLGELGISNRLTLEIADNTREGIEMLAAKLTTHLGGWLSEMLKRSQALRGGADPLRDLVALDRDLINCLANVPKGWKVEVDSTLTRPFLEQVRRSQIGHIPLTPTEYYRRIQNEMGRADSDWEILAVSTLTSSLWSDDNDQTRYAKRNAEAVGRGARIRRLFVVPEGGEPAYRNIVKDQDSAGIVVRIATNRIFASVPELEDFVVFTGPGECRGFTSLATIDGSRRIREGVLRVSENGTSELKDIFWRAWDVASPNSEQFWHEWGLEGTKPFEDPPGKHLKPQYLNSDVVTCEQAARARGIPLANELKSLILRTCDGLVVAHLPGDGVLSLRKVKARLESAEAYLADPEDLFDLGLSAGTVSALLEPVWSMPHLVSRRLLDIQEIFTNNGTRRGYFSFSPDLLVGSPNVIIADFEK